VSIFSPSFSLSLSFSLFLQHLSISSSFSLSFLPLQLSPFISLSHLISPVSVTLSSIYPSFTLSFFYCLHLFLLLSLSLYLKLTKNKGGRGMKAWHVPRGINCRSRTLLSNQGLYFNAKKQQNKNSSSNAAP
jgi:hypothetical protein